MNAPATKPQPHATGGLASRLVVAAIVIAAFVALAWADATGFGSAAPVAWLLPIAVLVAVGAGREAVQLAAARGIALAGSLVPATAAAIAMSPALATWAGVEHGSPLAAVGAAAVTTAAAVATVFVMEITRYVPGAGGLARVCGSSFAAVAIGLPLAFMVSLRFVGQSAATAAQPLTALVPLVSLVAVVKAGDVAAYAVGSLVGRHRLAATLSPGKTWEGAAASLVASLTMAWLVIEWGGAELTRRPIGGWPAFGLLVGLAGMAGDLAESLVKRDLAAKDSGRSLGGMGGFLDLIDALLLAAPVAWLLWVLG